jgi:hypothetical protein
MNDLKDENFVKVVKDAFASPCEHELDRDLWPQMRDKLHGSSIRVPWFDWVLAAVTILLGLLVPEVFAGVLFNL